MAAGRSEQRENEIFDFIVAYRKETGYSPAVRDIMQAIDVYSTATVSRYLAKLKQKGRITGDSSKGRSLVPVIQEK